jgi:hypothetical protein
MPREKNNLRSVAYVIATLSILAICNSQSVAQTVSWTNPQTGPTAGAWSNPANWDLGVVPGPLNTAEIANGGEARITSNVSASRIEVGKNGGIGTLTSTTAAVTISTDSDFDIGEIGGSFASGPIVVNSSGMATITDAAIINIGTGGFGDLDIGQTSATLGAQAFGVGMLTIERVPVVQVTDSMEIGKTSGSATADGQGTLVVDAVGTLQIGEDLDIGQSGGTGQSTGLGTVTITNTNSIVVGRGIDVGRTFGSSVATNRGEGNLSISDATILVGFADLSVRGSFNIGGTTTTVDQVARGVGTVTLEQVTLDVASRIKVGELAGVGTVLATTSNGTLNLIDSEVDANRLEVANVIGGTAGTVQGTVHLESSFVDLDSALTLGPTSLLEFGLAGTTKSDGSGAAGQYSAIDADSVTLDGDLNVFLTDGFAPSIGDTFQIISGLRTGTFNPVTFPSLSGGLDWNVQYNPDSVILQVHSSFSADFDTDGNVDGDDLTDWQISYGIGAGADADADGDSDGADFLAWQHQFGSGVPLLASSQSIPEPTAGLLCFTALAILAGKRFRLEERFWRERNWEGIEQ